MDMLTDLGRYVSIREGQTFLEDSILRLLFNFRRNPQNPNNVPMKLSSVVRAVATDERFVVAALEALSAQTPPIVEEQPPVQNERTFRITSAGVHFVRSMPRETDGRL